MRIPVISKDVLRFKPHTTVEERMAVFGPLNEAINAALAAENGRASSFAITSAQKVREIAYDAERRLETAGIPKDLRGGTIVTFRPSGPTARAYKHAAISTRIMLERTSKGVWFLTGIERTEVYPRQPYQMRTQITPAAADAVIRHALATFEVIETDPV